jgi:hypothetical protein
VARFDLVQKGRAGDEVDKDDDDNDDNGKGGSKEKSINDSIS